MVTLINISGGNLHLDSLDVVMLPGDRLPFNCELHELLVKAPELVLFMERGRVMLDESVSPDSSEMLDESVSPDSSEMLDESVSPDSSEEL